MFDDGKEPCLVFEAKMDSEYPEDADRVFAFYYYLEDKSVMILERTDPRKGIQGGRFLARMKIKDPKTGEFYDDDAFAVGLTVTAAGRDFNLIDAPEYTLCQMEAHANRFPQADLRVAVEAVARGAGCDRVRERFEERDETRSGKVPERVARVVLGSFGDYISRQAQITLLRRFAEGGMFNYDELLHYASSA